MARATGGTGDAPVRADARSHADGQSYSSGHGHSNGHGPTHGHSNGQSYSNGQSHPDGRLPGHPRSLGDALVLNATYEPLCVVSQRRAIVLVLTAKAVVVEGTDGCVHSPTRRVDIPAVVRLARFVRVPYRAEVPLTRKGVLARDGHRCAYCGAPATSLDHVIPRSRGGPHSWDNVVAACARCNHTKADRSVADLGWRLRSVPRAPSGTAWRVLGTRRVDPRWSSYLDGNFPQAASA